VNLQPLHPDAECQPLFCVSSKTGNGSDIQGLFDQIATEIQMQIPVAAISVDGDPSYNSRPDNFFIWWVDRYRDNGRNLDELLNSLPTHRDSRDSRFRCLNGCSVRRWQEALMEEEAGRNYADPLL
jgi:hypothetical protein